jgi:hypothetical protein
LNHDDYSEGRRKMKKLVLAMMLIGLVAGFAEAKEYEVTKKVGDFSVVVKIDKNPPVTGNNQFTVSVKDGKGADVTDAKVSVEYSMPAMPGMPAMNYSAKAEPAAKEKAYKAKVNFSMSGSWNIVVKIVRADKTTPVRFTVDAR